MAILDASILTAFYLEPDANHGAARGWMDAASARGERLDAPAIVLSEVAGAIRRRTGNVALGERAVANMIQNMLDELSPVTLPLAAEAARIANELRLKGCDAIYVALAAERDDVLVSFDREQLDRAAGAVRVVQPA